MHYPIVNCFTEHKREGVIFHGDCQYRSTHEWYDWAWINWDKIGSYIGKIYCFVDMEQSTYDSPIVVNGNSIRKGHVYAVISSLSETRLRNFDYSTIFSRGKIYVNDSNNEHIYLVSVDSIAETAFVIPNNGNEEKDFLVMTPRKFWSDWFIYGKK